MTEAEAVEGMTYQAGGTVFAPRTISDEYWLLSHHDYDGKKLVDDEVLQVGLAGAVLAELMLAGRLDIVDKRVMVRDARPTGDPVLDVVTSMIGNTRQILSPMKWAQQVSDSEYSLGDQWGGKPISLTDAVGRRLEAAGLVEEQQVRAMFRTTTRLVPVSWQGAAAPAIRIGYYLGRLNEMDTETRVLAKLALIVGLDGQIGAGYPFPVKPAIEAACQVLYPNPIGHEVLSTLLDGVDRAVAAVALRVRR